MVKGKSNKKHVRGPFCTIPQSVILRRSERRKNRAARDATGNEKVRKQIEEDYRESDAEETDVATPLTAGTESTDSATAGGEGQSTHPDNQSKGPKMSKQRKKKLDALKASGFFQQSEKSTEDLVKLKKEVEHVVVNCWDEEKLRREFPDMGCSHKFFQSGKFKIKYLLSKEGVPVCQIVKLPRV